MILTRGKGHAINQEMFHVSNKLSGYKNRRPYLKDNVKLFHCVKSLQIRTRKNPVFGNFSRSDLLIH